MPRVFSVEKWFFEYKRCRCARRCLNASGHVRSSLAEHHLHYSTGPNFKHKQLLRRCNNFHVRLNFDNTGSRTMPDLFHCIEHDLPRSCRLPRWRYAQPWRKYRLKQSTNLVGYSLILYFIPTFLCMVPSGTLHTVALLLAAILRFIFLGRNFSSRVDSK